MLEIYLTRHGQDLDNVNGILNGHRNQPLTELGIQQAKALAQHIKSTGISFDKTYSSPLIRAYKTAEIITEILEIEMPIVIDELIERDFGVMTSKPVSSVIELCSPDVLITDKINFFLSPDGAETFPQLIDRAKVVLEKIRQAHRYGKILLVTHGDLGQMLYAAYYNLPWKVVLQQFHFNNSDLLLLSPESKPEYSHVFHTIEN